MAGHWSQICGGRLAAFATAAAALALVSASASPGMRIPLPTGDAILVVSGAIERTSDGIAALFDANMLAAMASSDRIGSREICVVPLADLLRFVGARGSKVELRTLDDRRLNVAVPADERMTLLVIDAPACRQDATDSGRKPTVAFGAAGPDARSVASVLIERVVRLRVD